MAVYIHYAELNYPAFTFQRLMLKCSLNTWKENKSRDMFFGHSCIMQLVQSNTYCLFQIQYHRTVTSVTGTIGRIFLACFQNRGRNEGSLSVVENLFFFFFLDRTHNQDHCLQEGNNKGTGIYLPTISH